MVSSDGPDSSIAEVGAALSPPPSDDGGSHVTLVADRLADTSDRHDEWKSTDRSGPCGFPHDAPNARQKHLPEYQLFGAACAGSLRCVRHHLEGCRVDPYSVSQTLKHTLWDWAVHGGAESMKDYLRDRAGPKQRHNSR